MKSFYPFALWIFLVCVPLLSAQAAPNPEPELNLCAGRVIGILERDADEHPYRDFFSRQRGDSLIIVWGEILQALNKGGGNYDIIYEVPGDTYERGTTINASGVGKSFFFDDSRKPELDAQLKKQKLHQ